MTRMNEQVKQPDAPTQSQRRIRYGLNVAMAIVIAVLIAVMLNALVYRFREQLPRFDWTETRHYTLSQQTHNVLERLDDEVRLITLFHKPEAPGAASANIKQKVQQRIEQIQSAVDLTDEYARESPHISAEHIDPVWQPQQYDALLRQIRSRFESSTDPLNQTVERAGAAQDAARRELAAQIEPLLQLTRHSALSNPADRVQLTAFTQQFVVIQAELEKARRQADEDLEQTLPTYQTALRLLITPLVQLQGSFYPQAARAIDQIIAGDTLPADVKDQLLTLKNIDFPRTQRLLADALEQLRKTASNLDYERTRAQVLSENPVLLISRDRVIAVSLQQMLRIAADIDADRQAAPIFLGEEQLTGALAQLQMSNPPLVVFVGAAPVSPLTSPKSANEAQYTQTHVAQRLAALNFEITPYNPSPTPGHSRAGASSKPQPKPGQKVIWIFPSRPLGAVETSDADRPLVAKLLNERLAAGDSVLVSVGPNPGARFGDIDPVLEPLARWGFKPTIDRIILRERAAGENRTLADPLNVVAHWPGDHLIAQSLGAMPGAWMQSCPLDIVEPTLPNVAVTPLVRLQGSRLWAEDDFTRSPMTFNPQTAAGEFIIAAAAARADQRLIVVCNPLWAGDYITANASAQLHAGAIDLQQRRAAAYPGNTALFVNSVCWLAQLDHLVAPGASSKEVRRIGPIEPARLTGLKWTLTAGMPLGALIVGLTVFWVRRRD